MRIRMPRLGSYGWHGGLALLVVVPAAVLALLGVRAIRAERLEQQQLLRAHHRQAAGLLDAAIASRLEEIARSLTRGEEILEGDVFTIGPGGAVSFPADRLFFHGFSATVEWAREIEALIERAGAAEAQLRVPEAAASYRTIIGAEPRLRTWASLGLLRLEGDVDPETVERLAGAEAHLGVAQLTPTGLPASLVAVASLAQAPPLELTARTPLLERTLRALEDGRWPMTADERRFYHATIRDALPPSARPSFVDRRLEKLARVEEVLRRVPLPADGAATHFDVIAGAPLLIVVGAPGEGGGRRGVAIGAARLRRMLEALASGSGIPSASAIASESEVIAGRMPGEPGRQSEPLSVIRGWTLDFSTQQDLERLTRKSRLWLTFVALMIVTLIGALAVTIRTVRREAELIRIQNDFIAGVSHDFKSPITAVRLLLERMAGRRPPSDASSYLVAAGRELDRLERHVNTLLEAQLDQAGRRRFSFTAASLPEIVDSAICAVLAEAESRQITIAHEAAAATTVNADEAALTDALVNVLANAIRYSPPSSSITVRSREDRGHAVVEVHDQGMGIDRDELEAIFERFRRGRKGRAAGIGGSGLGLSLVRSTIEAHGGSIRAESGGKGSTFVISLPTAALSIARGEFPW